MPWCRFFLCLYLTLASLSLLAPWLYTYHIWKTFCHYFCQTFSSFTPWSSLHGVHFIYVGLVDIVLQVTEAVCFPQFFPLCSVLDMFYCNVSHSLVFLSVGSNLLLIISSDFFSFILDHVFITSFIYLFSSPHPTPIFLF